MENIGEVKSLSISEYEEIYELLKIGWIYLDTFLEEKSGLIFVFLGNPRK